MSLTRRLLTLVVFLLGTACDAPGDHDPTGPVVLAPLDTGWTFLGLRGETVYRLVVHGDVLYAGTANGIFQKSVGSLDTAWTRGGLSGRRIRALIGVEPATLLAAVAISGEGADTVAMHRTTDGGGSWRRAQNAFGRGEGSNAVFSLAQLPGQPDVLLASGGPLVVARSDRAAPWRLVWGDWTLGAVGVHVLQGNPERTGLVWAGGEAGFFQPFLVKSVNGGQTWSETIWLRTGGDNACYTVAFSPGELEVVYTGMEGRVMKTVDGGRTWVTVLAPSTYPYFFGLQTSRRVPGRVFAAGAVKQEGAQPLLLYRSDNGGTSWTTIREGTSLRDGIQQLLLWPDPTREALIVATGEGVYAYRVQP